MTSTSPSTVTTTSTATFNANTRNESSAIIASASSSSTMIPASANTINVVSRDQYNNQTTYIFNAPQNKSDGPSSSSGIAPSISFNDAPLGRLSPHFTGRRDELVHISKSFEVVQGDVPTCFVLYGGPGVGKSQLTLILAKESFAQGRYACIFWIPAGTVEKLYQGFSKLLHLVSHPDRAELEELVRLTAARRWLEDFASGKWLLVLDNVARDTVDFLREHLPRKNNRGNILFTTRTKDVAMALAHTSGEQHDILELRIPNKEDAARLLLGHFRDGEIDADESKVREVVKCVGWLPLAIAQAAAYMKQTGSTFDELLTIYKSEHKIDMMQWKNDLSTYQEKSVAAMFTYQLDDLQQQFPDVSNLLKILAYFDPEGIPLDMLITGASVLSNSQLQTPFDSVAPASHKRISLSHKFKNKLLQAYKGKGKAQADETSNIYTISAEMSSLLALIQSPIGLPNAIAQLQNRSLMKQQGTGQSSSLWMHDLTQLIVLDNTKKGGSEQKWFENAVELVCSAFGQIPDPDLPESWHQYEALIPHIQSLTIRREIFNDSNRSLLFANLRIAGYLRSRGRYNDGETLYKQVLLSLEKQLGPNHVDTLTTKHNLANVYEFQGRYSDAEVLYKLVLSSEKKQLGPKHVSTLATKHNLASVYKAQWRYSDAEVLYKQVLSGYEKQLGLEHVNTLTTKHNLANVYKSQGRYNDAEVLYKQVLFSEEEQLGPEHVNTLTTKHNLARVYRSQGRYSDAEVLYKLVLSSEERQLGPEHVETLTTKHNLARVYESQGRYSDAEFLYKLILSSQENQLGPEHITTLITKHNLASIYVFQGRYNDAEVLFKEILSNKEKQLIPERVYITKRNLAYVYESQGRYSDAEVLYKQILSSQEKQLGPKHVDTLTTKHSLAFIYKSQGRYAEAERLLENQRKLGLSHPHTQATERKFADVYMKQGRFDEPAEMSVTSSTP